MKIIETRPGGTWDSMSMKDREKQLLKWKNERSDLKFIGISNAKKTYERINIESLERMILTLDKTLI